MNQRSISRLPHRVGRALACTLAVLAAIASHGPCHAQADPSAAWGRAAIDAFLDAVHARTLQTCAAKGRRRRQRVSISSPAAPERACD